jgi:hypothetical protein
LGVVDAERIYLLTMHPELRQILEFVFVFLGLPLIALGLAYLLFKKPLEFLIDRILGTEMLVGKQSKTFRISFGGSGDNRGLTDFVAGKDAESQLLALRAQHPQPDVPPLLSSEREHYLEQCISNSGDRRKLASPKRLLKVFDKHTDSLRK